MEGGENSILLESNNTSVFTVVYFRFLFYSCWLILFFDDSDSLNEYNFDPDLVYTFDFFQRALNLSNFQVDRLPCDFHFDVPISKRVVLFIEPLQLNLGPLRYNILKALGVRPMQVNDPFCKVFV